MKKEKSLSPAALRALKDAVIRVPAYVLPLRGNVQGIARHSMLKLLRERGLIAGDPPHVTDKGRDTLIELGKDWIK